jgi:malonyl CoA-acyl carrier protein transacylase
MTNGTDRLDRIERILEEAAKRQDQFSANLAKDFERFSKNMDRVDGMLQEMAARQRYHDEAFEQHDAEMKVPRAAQTVDSENIRALARIAELHHLRLEHLEGGDAA